MKLLTYLQKTKNITRREFEDIMKARLIKINHELPNGFSATVAVWDIITITTREWVYEEKITKLPYQKKALVLFHKPKWYVVSKDDPHNKTIYELLPKSWKDDFYYVWRLDKDSTGLLLLTNDPQLVHHYESPQNDIHKVYQVEIDRPLKTRHFNTMRKWIRVTKEWNQPREWDKEADMDQLSVVTISQQKTWKWKIILTIVLNEWRNRHIRRLLSALWYKVKSLHRIKVWKWHIGTLKPRKWRIEHKRLK